MPARIKRFLSRIGLLGRGRPLRMRDIYPEHDIGRATYGNVEVLSFGGSSKLRIGSYCSFAKGVTILLGGEHRIDWVTTYPFNELDERFRSISGHPSSKGDVTIGSDVWIARDALILSGVSIGDGAVIGARAVVTRDVPAYTIVAGNPAALVRMRFPDAQVAALLAIRWWDWPEERVDRAVPYLQNGDVAGFIAKVNAGLL